MGHRRLWVSGPRPLLAQAHKLEGLRLAPRWVAWPRLIAARALLPEAVWLSPGRLWVSGSRPRLARALPPPVRRLAPRMAWSRLLAAEALLPEAVGLAPRGLWLSGPRPLVSARRDPPQGPRRAPRQAPAREPRWPSSGRAAWRDGVDQGAGDALEGLECKNGYESVSTNSPRPPVSQHPAFPGRTPSKNHFGVACHSSPSPESRGAGTSGGGATSRAEAP